MSRYSERADARRREGHNARRLDAVRVVKHAPLLTNFADFFDGLDYARLVISRHNGAENRVRADCPLHICGVDNTAFIGLYIRYLVALPFHIPRAFYKRGVLDCRNYQMPALVCKARALQRPVARLGSARNEKRLFGLATEKLCYFVARV